MHHQFQVLGSRDDLDGGIELLSRDILSINSAKSNYPQLANQLCCPATFLRLRFHLLKTAHDLYRAIEVVKQGKQLIPKQWRGAGDGFMTLGCLTRSI